MTLYVERYGKGEPLVLLHGWGLHGGIFAGLADRLAGCFELHIVDLPGHGRSAPLSQFTLEEVAAAVTASVPTGASWLGWSLGGMVALAAAAAHRLILVAASPRFVAGDDWPGTPSAVLAGFANDLADDYRATLNRFIALQARGSERARDELRALRADLFSHGEPDPASLQGGLAILENADLRTRLPNVAIPTLLIGGQRDTLVPAEALSRAAEALPAGRFAAIEGAGHAPFLSHPERFEQLVMEFLHE